MTPEGSFHPEEWKQLPSASESRGQDRWDLGDKEFTLNSQLHACLIIQDLLLQTPLGEPC